MVFLAITPAGLKDALRLAAGSGTAAWCGADAISEQAYGELKAKNLSRLIYELEARST